MTICGSNIYIPFAPPKPMLIIFCPKDKGHEPPCRNGGYAWSG